MVQLHVLGILALAEFDMSHHHQRRAGDENELQSPEANVGDGEYVVIADVGAAGLEKNENGDLVLCTCIVSTLCVYTYTLIFQSKS